MPPRIHRWPTCAFSAVLTAVTASLLMMSPAVHAQTTRQEQIASEQAEKAGELSPEGPGRAERAIVRIMGSPLLAGTGGPYPWFGSVYEGTKFGFGGGYMRRLPHASRLSTIAGASINGSTLLSADYTAPRIARGLVAPYASARWVRARDVSFYGVGNDSSNADRVGYHFDPSVLTAGVDVIPHPRLTLSAGYESVGFRTQVIDSRQDPQVLALLSDGTRLRFNATRFAVNFDTRASAGYSTRGTLLRASHAYYSEASDRPFEFRQTELEAVQLVPLLREQYVIALRGLATFTTPDDENGIPLPLLPYLGSGRTLRSFVNRRFVDRHTVLLTGEYRWRPSRFLDMALFVDAGQVAPTLETISWNRMRTGAGIGARIHGEGFTALRIDVARGSEGTRLVFTAGGPF